LRQSYTWVGKFALLQHERYAHATQCKRANWVLRKPCIFLGRVIRDIGREIESDSGLEGMFAQLLLLARRVREQHQRDQKVYSLHAPEVECIGKGKAHRPYEFGVKVSVATTISYAKGRPFDSHVKALPGNPYDRHTQATVIPDMERCCSATPSRASSPTRGISGPNTPPDYKVQVYISGQRRGVTPAIRRECAVGQPLSPSSAISRPSTAWAATISRSARATPPTPPATNSTT
jgi:IS5 family transposase